MARILVVDNEIAVVRNYRARLEGHEVIEAVTPGFLWDYVLSNLENIDIIVIGVRLDEVKWRIEIFERIRGKYKGTMIASMADISSRNRLMQRGFDYCVGDKYAVPQKITALLQAQSTLQALGSEVIEKMKSRLFRKAGQTEHASSLCHLLGYALEHGSFITESLDIFCERAETGERLWDEYQKYRPRYPVESTEEHFMAFLDHYLKALGA